MSNTLNVTNTNLIATALHKAQSCTVEHAENVWKSSCIKLYPDRATLRKIFDVYNMIYCDDFYGFDQTHAETFEQYFAYNIHKNNNKLCLHWM